MRPWRSLVRLPLISSATDPCPMLKTWKLGAQCDEENLTETKCRYLSRQLSTLLVRVQESLRVESDLDGVVESMRGGHVAPFQPPDTVLAGHRAAELHGHREQVGGR